MRNKLNTTWLNARRALMNQKQPDWLLTLGYRIRMCGDRKTVTTGHLIRSLCGRCIVTRDLRPREITRSFGQGNLTRLGCWWQFRCGGLAQRPNTNHINHYESRGSCYNDPNLAALKRANLERKRIWSIYALHTKLRSVNKSSRHPQCPLHPYNITGIVKAHNSYAC